MFATRDTTTEHATTNGTITHPPRPGLGDISPRLAGAGAMTFAVTVVAQNVIRGAAAPTNGAKTADVLAHYADHRALTFVLIATYVVSGIGLIGFIGGAARLLIAGGRRGWAAVGLVGATCILSLFAVVVAVEQALSVLATRARPEMGAVEALWTLHNSVFAVLDLSIAAALFGLARAGVAAGITPRAFARLAPAGAALLLVGTLAGPSIAAGDAMPLFGLAGLGFLVWLAFLFTTGLRLVRSESGR